MQSTSPSKAVRGALHQAARDAGYLTIGLFTSTLALVVWIVALSLSLSLVLFVIGLPVVIASASTSSGSCCTRRLA